MSDRTTKFWYEVEGGGRHWLELAGRYNLHDDFDLDRLATEAADDYHHNHDGWESRWPLDFEISATEDGPVLAKFSVDREAMPFFSARKLTVGSGVDTPDGAKHDRA